MDLNIRGENYTKVDGSVKLHFIVDEVSSVRQFKFALNGAVPTHHTFIGVNGFLSQMEVKLGRGCKSSKYIFNNHGKQTDTKICNLILANEYSFAYLDGFIVSAKKKKSFSCC